MLLISLIWICNLLKFEAANLWMNMYHRTYKIEKNTKGFINFIIFLVLKATEHWKLWIYHIIFQKLTLEFFKRSENLKILFRLSKDHYSMLHYLCFFEQMLHLQRKTLEYSMFVSSNFQSSEFLKTTSLAYWLIKRFGSDFGRALSNFNPQTLWM